MQAIYYPNLRMIPFVTCDRPIFSREYVIGTYTTHSGTFWFPNYFPGTNVVHQKIFDGVIFVVDPPSDLPVVPIQLYKRTLCVEYLILGVCDYTECCQQHIRRNTLIDDLNLYRRRDDTVGSAPEAVDDLERRTACASAERMKDWTGKQPYFGIVIFSKNHPVYWIRNFKSIDIGRMEFWEDLECIFTDKKRVVIVQKPIVADLRFAQAIKLYTKPLCLFYFQNGKCERTNCTFLHRSEDEIALAIAKRYYEIKCLTKSERFDHIVHIDGLGQTSQFTSNEKLRYLMEERELKKSEKSVKETEKTAIKLNEAHGTSSEAHRLVPPTGKSARKLDEYSDDRYQEKCRRKGSPDRRKSSAEHSSSRSYREYHRRGIHDRDTYHERSGNDHRKYENR